MLCLIFLFLYTFGSQPIEGAKAHDANPCTLPPYPKNGGYVVLDPEVPNLSPGDKVHSYTIQVTCDPGYNNTDNVIYTCFDDGNTYGEVSECLPFCNRQENIMSCGMGVSGEEARCIAPTHDDLDNALARYTPEPEPECGTLGAATATVISGGQLSLPHEMPWHAAIYTKATRPYMQICGGSIVSTTVVISAAHCFWSEIEKQLPASKYAVAAGKIYRPYNDEHDGDAQKSDVSEIKIPTYFQGSATNLQADIALVKLASPFFFTDSVRPVCLDFNLELDRKQLTAGTLGKVAGWGLTSEDGPSSPILKVVKLPVVDIKDCFQHSDPTFQAYITSDKICAGYQNDDIMLVGMTFVNMCDINIDIDNAEIICYADDTAIVFHNTSWLNAVKHGEIGTSVCKGDSGGGLCFLETSSIPYHYYLRGVVSGAPRSDHLCNTFSWASFTHLLNHEHFIRETVPVSSQLEINGPQK